MLARVARAGFNHLEAQPSIVEDENAHNDTLQVESHVTI